jgi:hypothetical protein
MKLPSRALVNVNSICSCAPKTEDPLLVVPR